MTLPDWIKVNDAGLKATMGISHITKGFRSKQALIRALQPYLKDGDNWQLYIETDYSRNGKAFKSYKAVIKMKEGEL
jgi:hypothetical protein